MKYGIKVIRSDGLIFDYDGDFRITSLKGADFASFEIFKQPRGVGSGDIITGKRKSGRVIEIEAVSKKYIGLAYRNARNNIIGYHSIDYTYTLEITYIGLKRIAKDCVISAISYPTERFEKNAIFKVAFSSPYSELFETNETGINFSEKQALWKYPHSFIEGKPLMFATEKAVNDKVISYQGSSSTQPVIKITALGYAKNIKIKFGDTVININTELRERDVLLIDCSKSYATINDEILPFENVEYFDFRNLKIDFGDTLISVNAEVGGNAIKTEVNYIGRYDGV